MTNKPGERPIDCYEDIVNRDVGGAPKNIAHGPVVETGTDPIAADRYWCADFYAQENKYLWTRTWQMVCLVDDIPNSGDCFHYEIADRSLIIANTGNGFRAYFNACLHRGRKLITRNCRKTDFVCPFHGITWSLDGKLIRNPIAWDMPQWNEQNASLPEARVAVWGRFIFICMDDDAPDFEQVAAPLIEHFEPYDWDNRYRAWWIEKHVPANWKVVQEAFMESHHTQTTHPQLLPSIADINSQYDYMNAYVGRQISAGATPSPGMDPTPEEHEQLRLMQQRGDRRVEGVDLDALPDNFRARTYLADFARRSLTESLGRDHSHAKDSELLDYTLYSIFPNMTFWYGYGPKLVYCWRPEPGNPEGTIMDIMWMEPLAEGQERPQPAEKVVAGYSDRIASLDVATASLRRVLDQDFGNLPHVQTGMKSLRDGVVNFASYTESRLRYLHRFIDKYIETGELGKPPPGVQLPD